MGECAAATPGAACGSVAREGRGLAAHPARPHFAAVDIKAVEELVDLFIPRYYIGCEADDRSVAQAMDTKLNPYGQKIRAMFGSDQAAPHAVCACKVEQAFCRQPPKTTRCVVAARSQALGGRVRNGHAFISPNPVSGLGR